MISFLFIFIIMAYLFIIGWLSYGFNKVDDFKMQDLPLKTTFSVVIPFRNEAENLPKLLESISKLNYPKSMFEVILVDDDSEDDSVAILNKLISDRPFDCAQGDIQVIKNKRTSNSPKKDAITSAIRVSKYDWIVTTDADCILPQYWLDTFNDCIQLNHSNCIVAPVTYHSKTSFLNRFQTLDFLSLQGATIGGFGIKKPFLCNGANFAYRKSEFKSVKGFEGNDTIASGDDVFLLEKFIKLDAKKVQYLKSRHAIVTTNATKTMTDLIQQRLRWASKTSQNTYWFTKAVGLIVFLGNFVCLGLLPAMYFNGITLKTAIALFVIKLSIDFLLLFKTVRFFKQETLLVSYVFSSFLYPIFNVCIAFLSFFTPYNWKGRRFAK
ncbi:glycosyltransferase [Winogradskyella sp. F6397]|uniref:Glycosyltransferase n=1 Tax=Winogradskyella marina TaxID=2785530 RepID=A0ABS0EE91_9FLAO|nr:glycosyltransferase [Winogradskyella marina]MBF8148775.1 glycosyltransferase [Winogradskyella marina]